MGGDGGLYLIIGTGSVGRRHARNLASLGARVACFDPRADRLEQVRAELPGVAATYTSFAEAVAAGGYAGAVIGSPPSVHVEQSVALLEQRIPVLLEKPVSPDLASARRLEEVVERTGTPLLLGYTYRWWPPLIELRRRVHEGAIGAPRHARIVMSAHLADWHPWERYQDFFMASRELGGGALLDESHFIDQMLWFFGVPELVFGRAEHVSALEITTDDNVDLVAVYPAGLRVNIHLDLFGRPHEKLVSIVGERGTLQCAFDPNVVRFSGDAAGTWEETRFDCERNDMFLAVAREFLDVVRGVERPSCTIRDGVDVLRCVEAVRLSTDGLRAVWLADV
jgi:predicted dehydrogenase